MRWVAALAATVALWAGAASGTEVVEAYLDVVGQTDLGGGGPFDDVAVVGTTAVVAGDCPDAAVRVVGIKDARRPAVVSTVSLPPGTRAAEVDAASVLTPAFTGDLLALALAPCGRGTSPGAVFYDVSDPAAPRFLGDTPGCDGCGPRTASMSLAQRGDGRAVSLRHAAPGTVVLEDVSDPRRPAVLGRWSPPDAVPPSCVRGEVRSAVLQDDGQGAVVVLSDGRVFQLDLGQPTQPSAVGDDPAPAGAGGYGAVMPVGARTLAIVADEGSDGACAREGGPGLRLLELSGGVPRELDPVRFTTGAAPGRLVASGELAYVAWHGDGLRIVDLGQVRPRAVAQFIPAQPAVVGVGLLPNHVVAVDRNSGLYVLERPEEAGNRSSFWSDLVGLLPYLGFAGLLVAAIVIPQLAMGRAPGRSHVPSPVPEPTRAPRSSG